MSSQTGTKIIQILAIVAFLILALSMLASWKTHREIRDFHKERFEQLTTILKVGMTKDEVQKELEKFPYEVQKPTEKRWHIRWFDENSKDAKRFQTERLGVPTSAEVLFRDNGTLEKINGLE